MAGAEECLRRGRTKEWEEQRLTLTTKAPYKPDVAVCILPGTELAFERDVEYDHFLGFFPRRQLRERVARFRQVNRDDPFKHHDALEFPSGEVVLLNRLWEGQRATVLQLPALGGPERAEARWKDPSRSAGQSR